MFPSTQKCVTTLILILSLSFMFECCICAVPTCSVWKTKQYNHCAFSVAGALLLLAAPSPAVNLPPTSVNVASETKMPLLSERTVYGNNFEILLNAEDITIIINSLHHYKKVEKKDNCHQYDLDRVDRLRDTIIEQMRTPGTNIFPPGQVLDQPYKNPSEEHDHDHKHKSKTRKRHLFALVHNNVLW